MASKSVQLSARQQSHALSSKKKKTKKTFRYSLAQTFPRYWPQLTEAQSQYLQELLKKAGTEHPQWFAGKKANTDVRPIHYGLQSSIRKLKTGQIKLLILSADLKPRYVANQIILQALATNKHIRILCVPNLDSFTQTILKFSCYAFVISNWSNLSQLDKWTADLIGEHFPVPQLIESYFDQRREKTSTMEVNEPEMKKPRLTEEMIEVNRFYLKRENCKSNERAFVPKNANNLKPIALEIESLNKIKSEFISLDTYNNSYSQAKQFHKKSKNNNKTPLALYRDLTVHKVQGNPNKVKKIRNKNKKQKHK